MVKGTETEPNEFPWQVLVKTTMDGGVGSCGGSIISPQHVITAAHCTSERGSLVPQSPNDIEVFIGDHNIEDGQEDTRKASNVINHPKYEIKYGFAYAYDLSIITHNGSPDILL